MKSDKLDFSVVSFVDALSYLVTFVDKGKSKNDILENKPLRRSVGRQCSKVVEDYEDFVRIFKVVLDVVKHIKRHFEELLAESKKYL